MSLLISTKKLFEALALRMPRALETYWSVRRRLGFHYPEVDRWLRLNDWLRQLDQSEPRTPPGEPRRVLFFSEFEWWIDLSLLTAVALVGHGCVVDFAYVNQAKTNSPELTPIQLRHARYARDLVVPHPRLRIVDLDDAASPPLPIELDEKARTLSSIDTQYHFQKEEIDLEGNQQHRSWFEFRLKRNRAFMARFLAHLRRHTYDVLVVPNAAMFELGAAYHVARWFGLRCASFEGTERLDCASISDTLPCVFQDLSALWQADEPHALDAGRRSRIVTLLQGRENASLEKTILYQRAPALAADQLKEKLRIPPNRRVALMCTNLSWDSAVVGQQVVFPSMAEWIRSTVSWFTRREDWHLIVRVHPAEAICSTGEPGEQIIADHLGALPENITVIAPKDTTNTYGLMRLCEFGLVYTSTVGLEMATKGIPVVVAGKVHYRGNGFTLDPPCTMDYWATLDQLTSSPGGKLSEREVELALCYANILFHDWPRPFPWNNDCVLEKAKVWPVSRVLSPEGRRLFSPSFNVLAGFGRVTDRSS